MSLPPNQSLNAAQYSTYQIALPISPDSSSNGSYKDKQQLMNFDAFDSSHSIYYQSRQSAELPINPLNHYTSSYRQYQPVPTLSDAQNNSNVQYPPLLPIQQHSQSTLMSTFTASPYKSTKKHICDVCGKRFTRPSSLQTHGYSHTGEKPFQCDVSGCGRYFSVISNLRRHKKIHVAE